MHIRYYNFVSTAIKGAAYCSIYISCHKTLTGCTKSCVFQHIFRAIDSADTLHIHCNIDFH